MTALFAKTALLPAGWAQDVRVILANGRITGVSKGVRPEQEDQNVDVLLPAPANLHSHTFQRAMAGMAEHRTAGQDSFWTWRDLMYRFLDRLTPEQIQAIAAQAFIETLEAGFASIGEFHYLHHAPGGMPYDVPAELSVRIAAAAADTGIGLTHLPVLYMQGGSDGRDLIGGQLRFGNTLDGFADLLDRTQRAVATVAPDAATGVAPHSLRAVPVEALTHATTLRPDAPFHIHIAEQRAEVVEILATHGATPVKWLLEILEVDARWCLIHATHMTPAETEGLARSGAVTGLCPITESNLGDGIFDGARFAGAGGRFGVGSDSNVRISLTEELRTLEYSQRLQGKARAVLAEEDISTGRFLFDQACRSGAQALGRKAGQITEGYWADLLALDTDHLALAGLVEDQLLDGWIFAGDDRAVTDVWSAGRHVVRGGRHKDRDSVEAAYRHAIADLRAAL
ncbi:MAG: formimidoylglutamate deiminase [Pseudomonadota bacterium]